MIFECKTIAKPVREILFKEKGSKFIGFAFPVLDENEIKIALEEIKKQHPQATHHCYAYRLGFEGENYRANDDGEPSGSAGLPIYNQILSADLSFVLVIVVRYYGGTKLGVSGLIKAYKTAVELALNETKIKKLIKTEKIKLNFPYTTQGEIMRLIEKHNGKILEQTFLADCTLKVEIPLQEFESFSGPLESVKDLKILKD